jgi:hypothetical protein
MEAGLAGDFGVVQQVGIEHHAALVGAAAEEVQRAAAPHHIQHPMPGFGFAHGFHGDVGAAAAGERAHGLDGIDMLIGAHQFVRAHGLGAVQLRAAPADGDHAAPIQARQPHEHQPDGSQAQNGDGVARTRRGLFKALQHASQRLDQCGVVITDALRNAVGVALHDARGMRMYSA